MAISKVFKTVAAGAVAIFAATSLVACSSGSSSSVSLDSTAVRKASGYLPSRVCVENYTNETIMYVGEFEMNRTGVSHPDPAGPLKPFDAWCTDGYNAFSDVTGMPTDAIVEVKFSDAPGDFVRFAFRNGYMWGDPYMMFGQEILDNTFPTADDGWYRDFNLPASGRNFFFQVPYESPDFQEWSIEVN